MKILFLTVILIATLALASCATNDSAVNHNGTNHNMMNHSAMNHNMPDHNSMDHGAMKSSPDAASAPYDLQFIDTMTHHHEGAVTMAKMVLAKSNNEELKKFAQKIIDDQQKEIAQMKDWREKWFAGKPPALNMEMPGMTDSVKMMSGEEMEKMSAMKGRDFDLHFLEMMILHHQDAVEMANDALEKAEHQEIKTLAKQIFMEQEAEIKKMAEWKTAWSK
jgi:uncharacterized protein (DUF305 family)